jgi:hypothetical protein
MPYLSRDPQTTGPQVVFNDHVFRFANDRLAREAARKLAEVNRRNSLWELVDLVTKLEAAAYRLRSLTPPGRG